MVKKVFGGGSTAIAGNGRHYSTPWPIQHWLKVLKFRTEPALKKYWFEMVRLTVVLLEKLAKPLRQRSIASKISNPKSFFFSVPFGVANPIVDSKDLPVDFAGGGA